MADFITGLLKAAGIDPTGHPYFALAALIVIGVVYLRWSIGGKLTKIKENVLVIVTHLATSRTSKLDTNLIKAMSPLQIQPAGRTILVESGLQTIMQNPECRKLILKHIQDMNPVTKLDVEQKCIVLFETIMLNSFMNPIKTYLYEHPAAREIMPTLAGLYFRDEYLKDHPEITN